MTERRPQPGPQERFLSTSADICIYGGSAGGGKTFALLLGALRYKDTPGFNCTIFRKNFTQIFIQGGLWDESLSVYSGIKGARRRKGDASWVFTDKDGRQLSKVSFAHVERKEELDKWQGSQICALCCEVGTPILMADGSYKDVAEIAVGDVVKTLNGDYPVTAVGLKEWRECVEIKMDDGTTQRHTTDHKILTQDGWVSYEDIILQELDKSCCSLLPKLSRFLSKFDESSAQRCEALVTHLHKIHQEILQIDESVRANRADIDTSRRFLRILRELHQILNDDSIGCCSASERARCSLESIQAETRLPDTQLPGQRQVLEASQGTPENRGSLETFVCKAQRDRESCFESSADSRQERERHISDRLSREHLVQACRSLQDTSPRDAQRDGFSSAQICRQLEDSPGSCSAYCDLYDECTRLLQDNDLASARRLDGVVVHNPRSSSPCGMGKTHRDNCLSLSYSHPYIDSERFEATECTELRSIHISPCGEKLVRTFTVDTMNYYITRIGVVNKNCFDEITHFQRETFFYMLSRNRSTCGVKPYVRATCNPDANSWVAEFISWWIDQDTGYPIPERSGVKRWFIRRGEDIFWADTKKELIKQFELKTPEEREEPKSVTFIASSIYDNQELLKTNPQYLANLKALATVERERLLYGNWKIKPSSGMYFKRTQVEVLKALPTDVQFYCRAWDLAATEDTGSNDPDYTAGILMGRRKDGSFVIADIIRERIKAGDVQRLILNTAKADRARYGPRYTVRIPQDPGAAGKIVANSYAKLLAGFAVKVENVTGSKETRATPLAAQWQNGNVAVLEGPWLESYFTEMENFPEGQHDDMVDASSDAFNELAQARFNLSSLL